MARQQKRRTLFGIVKLCPEAVLACARLDRKPEFVLHTALHDGCAELGDERRVRRQAHAALDRGILKRLEVACVIHKVVATVDLGRHVGRYGAQEGVLPVRRRAELANGQDLALVQMKVDVDQFNADACRNVVFVQEAFQVVEIVREGLGDMLHVMYEGNPVIHRH